MRHRLLSIPLLMVMLLLALSGCVKENCHTTTKAKIYLPVYKGMSEVRAASEKVLPASEIGRPGKIYVKGKYILVNEPSKGIHIIDNSQPAAPRAIAFLNVMGNVDMAVQDNILYADSFRDLMLFDISDPRNIRFLKRFENVMGYTVDLYGRWLGTPGGKGSDSILVGYDERDTTYTSPCEKIKGDDFVMYDNQVLSFSASSFKAAAGGGSGKGGSMARFAITHSRLYTVDRYALTSFNISSPANPVKGNSVNIGGGIETIFPYEDFLYIGSNSAMFIYDLVNPDAPARRSVVQHVTACDPVVVEGKTAYVTVRTGTFCAGTVNELQVYDVTNVDNPVRLATYQMSNPHGLGIDNGKLFICEGGFGLRFMNAPSASNITTAKMQTGLNAYDVIPFPGENRLLVSAVEGIYQYDYSSIGDPRLLSRIPVKN